MTLEMRGICKSFGSNDVLKHVDFSIQGGEICALLGENGAGKSTLMNILGGVLPADRGEIVIDGAAVHFRTPSDSLSAGVAFIHQELSLINDLAIYENMFIGRELKTKYGLLDAKTMIQKTQEVFDRLELHLDPRTMVRELDASYKQIVEISRAMMMEASLIIMDEPTTSLTDPEIERVFDMMRMLQKQNVAIVFISHKLNEIMAVADRVTVLRKGQCIGTVETKDTNQQALSNMKPKLDNYIFREWVDAAIACQDDKSLKSTLTPIIGKLSDMRIVAAELDYLMYEPFKEFITMAFLLVGNIPLLYFLNKDWYNVLVNTGFGKGILAVCLLVLLISFAAVIRLTKPVEYKR